MSDKPVYQLKMSNGSWIDQELVSYEYNLKHGHEVRALYPVAAYKALENERDELKQSLDDLQERFNGIKFIESELRKELAELTAERNRRDEMRKALEAQMGISNKW